MNTTEAIRHCSNAMIMIAADTFASFDDGSAEARVAAALYETTVMSALSEHRWNFAVQIVQASKLATAPVAGYANAYRLPAGLIELETTNPAHIQYELYGPAELHTGYDGPLYIQGKFRPDESDWPPYFQEYIEVRLAQKFALPITSDSAIISVMSTMVEEAQKRAKSADSRQRKGVGLKRFPLTDVR